MASMAMTECAYVAPARISAATQIASMSSCSVAFFGGEFRVAADAVGALCHMRDRHCDELLGLLRQGAIGKDAPPECAKRAVNFWRQLLSLLRQLFGGIRIHVVFHCERSFR